MALSSFQRELCRLLASSRRATGQSYVAGGVALTEAVASTRLSEDVDVFHDTAEALAATWSADLALLQQEGYTVEVVRKVATFGEAKVSRGGEGVVLQWVNDSAFRFFPLLPHPLFGLTMHPLDLATNKMMALVGRTKTRDWVDALECHRKIAPVGLLAWAACGKDEGWNPQLILDESARTSRASPLEMAKLEWEGERPDTDAWKQEWRAALANAHETIRILPPEEVGRAVLNQDGSLFRGSNEVLALAVQAGRLRFHQGHIGGAWPQIKA